MLTVIEDELCFRLDNLVKLRPDEELISAVFLPRYFRVANIIKVIADIKQSSKLSQSILKLQNEDKYSTLLYKRSSCDRKKFR